MGAALRRFSSARGIPPILRVMPTLIAMLMASVVGWLVEGPARALLGPGFSLATSLVVSTVAFYFARRFVSELRDGS